MKEKKSKVKILNDENLENFFKNGTLIIPVDSSSSSSDETSSINSERSKKTGHSSNQKGDTTDGFSSVKPDVLSSLYELNTDILEDLNKLDELKLVKLMSGDVLFKDCYSVNPRNCFSILRTIPKLIDDKLPIQKILGIVEEYHIMESD
jgi:hypothetical protein